MRTVDRELRQAIRRGDAAELTIRGSSIPLHGMLDPRQNDPEVVRVRVRLEAGPTLFRSVRYEEIIHYRIFSLREDGSYRDHFEERE